MISTLRTTIKCEGQPFVDEPIHVYPIPETELQGAIRAMFRRRSPPPLIIGYERVRLRWMKPGPDGKMVPR